MLVTEEIEITETTSSRLPGLDFSNLPFGKVFSDHMFTARYKDGQWGELKITPYGMLEFSPAFITLHYGQAIFEGMKAYRNLNDEIVLFRPDENSTRFNRSAERLCMPEVPQAMFIDAIKKLVALDRNWVPTSEEGSLYIRPHMFATDQFIGVQASTEYTFCIFTCPSGPYFSRPVKLKIETHYTRAAAGGVGFAKAAANYASSLYPTKIAIDEGFDQVIWTDGAEHKYIEEAGTMNVFFRIGDELVTPALGDTILDGITRKSVIQTASDLDINVIQRRVSVEEIIQASENGTLLEAFGSGTAATISEIAAIGFNGKLYELPANTEARAFSKAIKTEMDNIKSGAIPDTHNWIQKV